MNRVSTPPNARLPRRPTLPVRIGPVTVGGESPVVVQSMTNTDTADVAATVRQVAVAHRGSVQIESKPGRGTRVSVRLPLEESAARVKPVVTRY